jgi:hypothetical protein
MSSFDFELNAAIEESIRLMELNQKSQRDSVVAHELHKFFESLRESNLSDQSLENELLVNNEVDDYEQIFEEAAKESLRSEELRQLSVSDEAFAKEIQERESEAQESSPTYAHVGGGAMTTPEDVTIFRIM